MIGFARGGTPTLVLVIVGLAGLAFLGWIVWISVQSLIQAKLLRRARDCSGHFEEGQAAGIYGELMAATPLEAEGRGNLLYFKVVEQEQRGMGKNRRWVTLSTQEEMSHFSVRSGDREVRVTEAPTEIQGLHSDTRYGYNEGAGWFGASRRLRRTVSWMPVTPHLAVVGRLTRAGSAWIIGRDGVAGLFITPHEPGRAAATETMKAVAGLVFAGAAVTLGVLLMLGVL